jgi:hypothetical protein
MPAAETHSIVVMDSRVPSDVDRRTMALRMCSPLYMLPTVYPWDQERQHQGKHGHTHRLHTLQFRICCSHNLLTPARLATDLVVGLIHVPGVLGTDLFLLLALRKLTGTPSLNANAAWLPPPFPSSSSTPKEEMCPLVYRTHPHFQGSHPWPEHGP